MHKTVRTLLVATSILAFAAPAAAQDTAAQKEANTHFQRAIGLYGESDYRAALVEFKRAYELAPHVTLLYNLGQTQYQLQNYAEALSNFERFLAEGGTAHKSEVENAVAVLKARVGKLDIAAPAGAEITVDDEPAGKAPLAKPVAVSVGRRRVTATKPGETPVTRFVEVAAGETVGVNLQAGAPVDGAKAAPIPNRPETKPDVAPPAEDKPASRTPWIVGGWSLTAALAGTAVATGIVSLSKASALTDARNKVPATKDDLDARASSVKTFALMTDIFAAGAIVVGGVSLYLTLTKPSSSTTKAVAPARTTRISWAGSRFVLEGTF